MSTSTEKMAVMAALCGVLALSACTSQGNPPDVQEPSAAKPTSQNAVPQEPAVNPEVARLMKHGIDQAQKGDYDGAVASFNSVLVIDPRSVVAQFNLGLVAQTRKEPKKAIAFYDKALAVDPKYTPAMYNKAIALEPSDLSGAIKLYEQIIAINPKASTAFMRLSAAYRAKGDRDKADEMRDKALALDPKLESPAPPKGQSGKSSSGRQ